MYKEPMGINIFKDRQTSKRFAEIIQFLPPKEAKKFGALVRELFDKKIVSDEGEYDEFVITKQDLSDILTVMGEKNGSSHCS